MKNNIKDKLDLGKLLKETNESISINGEYNFEIDIHN